MFGRVRAAPSPADSLQRAPSKILKDDSLSIYESTLMKLKKGSQRQLISPPMAEAEIEADCVSGTALECNLEPNCVYSQELMMIDTDCSSASLSSTSSDSQSTVSSGQEQTENVSIVHLFSKYKGYQHAPNSSNEKITIGNDGSSESITNDGQSLSSIME